MKSQTRGSVPDFLSMCVCVCLCDCACVCEYVLTLTHTHIHVVKFVSISPAEISEGHEGEIVILGDSIFFPLMIGVEPPQHLPAKYPASAHTG